jgi:hypothetical protein
VAIVRKLERVSTLAEGKHLEVDCTYAVVVDDNGRRWLQVDTYGSKQRKLLGKKSQTIRFSPEAIAQLRKILTAEIA